VSETAERLMDLAEAHIRMPDTGLQLSRPCDRDRERARPMARFPGQIAHCAICVQTNHGPAALLNCNLTPHALPDDRAALTAPGQPPISNPHRWAGCAAPTGHAGPRFPPPRLLGRLPPEHAAAFLSGRHPRSLNESRHSSDRLSRFPPRIEPPQDLWIR
jgi:hypothetical protein